MNNDKRYNSTMAGKGAYLPETKRVLEEIAAGESPDQVRGAVIDADLLDQRTLQSRKNYWKAIYRRYISGRDPGHVADLAAMVAHCSNAKAVDLVLFYEYCQVDDLLYDLTVKCTYPMYEKARTSIGKLDVLAWLERQEENHPEVAGWSPSTRNRLIGSYLSTIRDFGLVQGSRQKEFYTFYVPREAFVYVLYHQKDRGMRSKQIINSKDWRLFLMSDQEIMLMLEEAVKGGFIHFRRAGDIYYLQFLYEDLSEAVDAITN